MDFTMQKHRKEYYHWDDWVGLRLLVLTSGFGFMEDIVLYIYMRLGVKKMDR